ncbi:MAG: hypothetical protein ACRD88_08185, partial [Terriglobia bacterium]
FYVSPRQINFQVPNAIAQPPHPSGPPPRVGHRLPVVVTTATGTSDPVLAYVQDNAAGIFSQGGGECGPGLIQNVTADGSVTLNTPSNSASPGSFIIIYGTGLGPLYSPPEDGHPARVQPLTGLNLPGSFLGIKGFTGRTTQSWWAGLTPGLVGVNQVNVLLGDDPFEGCAVPLHIGGMWTLSPPVTMSIRRGGGPCQDAPPASFANLVWRKVITTSSESPSGASEATFTASYFSAPENLVAPGPDPPELPFGGGCPCGGMSIRESPRCKNAGLTALDAGALRLDGVPGGPLTLLPSPSGEETGYSLRLPPGSLDGGTLRVTGAGGTGVGGFDTDVTVPPPIQVTTSLAPGTVIDIRRPFSVAWSGGSPDTIVRMRLISYRDQEGIFGNACDCHVFASEGTAKLDVGQNPAGEVLLRIFTRSENAEVVLTVTPRTSKLTQFAAPGLTREGRHDWSYEYHFKGLKIR